MTGALESCVYTSLPSWKILSALLCTLTEVHPRTYVKQCFLMRSPPPELPNQLLTLLPGLKLTPPTTATTSARSLSPGNCYHHPSFHPWRHLLSARSDYTRCCTSSWATRCLKIKFFVHNNKMPKSLKPEILFVASDWDLRSLWQLVPTELVECSVTGMHLNKASWRKETLGIYSYDTETTTTLTSISTNIFKHCL